MADDKEVLREVWEGRLPVCFNISTAEVVTIEEPEPCYYLVPRGSYFPLVMDKVFVHFQKASNQVSYDPPLLFYIKYGSNSTAGVTSDRWGNFGHSSNLYSCSKNVQVRLKSE